MKLDKLFLISVLFLVSVGGVCATDPDIDPFVKKLIDDNSQLTTKIYNQSVEIKHIKDNNTQLDKRVKTLEDSNNQLNNTVKRLEDSNKRLEDSNKRLEDSNNQLNNTVNNQSVIINSLKTDNEALNVKINNQSVIINELNNKLELQLNEIKQLQADKDKLNAEKCSIYEKLLSSPKKEDYEQLKKDMADKDNKIKELNTKIKILNNILNINKKDVVNSLKALSSTNIQNIKCGKYTFKLEDYLKIPLIKDGKKNVLKFKKDNGRLPKYVIIGDYKVPQNIYKKLYNL